jgi:hypothetical protein
VSFSWDTDLFMSFKDRRFGEKKYAAAKMVVAIRTTDAPDGRSRMYETTRPETQAPIPDAAEMRKKCFKL